MTIVFPEENIDQVTMLKIAQELKQFETTFVFRTCNNKYLVKVFTVQEELEFAGHPIIGTAGILHELDQRNKENAIIEITLGTRILKLESSINNSFYEVKMNQGIALTLVDNIYKDVKEISSWFGLKENQISEDYPLSIMTTGLPYLLIPVKNCLEKIRISIVDLETKLKKYGAKFVYFFDPRTLECRTWDNTGLYEDVATGSAAGPLISYLVNNGYKERNQKIVLKQGKYLNRESKISGYVNDENEVVITGAVSIFAKGEILI